MFKSIFVSLIIIMGIPFSISSKGHAYEYFYLSAYEAFSTFHDKSGFEYRPNISMGVALGSRILPCLRTEIESNYRSFEGTEIYYRAGQGSFWNINPTREIGRADTVRFTAFGNIIYDLIFRENFTPYLGGGFGYEIYRSKFENNREYFIEERGRGLAVQWIAGFRMPFFKSSKFNMEYRLLSNAVGSRSQMIAGKFSHHF